MHGAGVFWRPIAVLRLEVLNPVPVLAGSAPDETGCGHALCVFVEDAAPRFCRAFRAEGRPPVRLARKMAGAAIHVFSAHFVSVAGLTCLLGLVVCI